MALEAGVGATVSSREKADPKLAILMLRLTEDPVRLVTTVPDDEDPTADSQTDVTQLRRSPDGGSAVLVS